MAEAESLKLLRALDEGVAAKTGEEFFPHLVSALARTLGASCAFASEIVLETYKAHALAYWCNDRHGDLFVYNLAGTPCECVLNNEIVAFPRDVRQLFPADERWFKEIGAESFLAIPLSDERGKVRGHLAVIDRRPRDWSEVDFEILRIFSTRAAAELDRRDYQKRLETTNAALQKANGQLRREVTHRLDVEEQLATNTAHNEHVAELIRVIASGVSSKTGNDFFTELVRSLCEALKAHTVFVTEVDTVKYEADMLAFWTAGAFATPVRFALAGSPCESILDGKIAAFPRRVKELFPAAAAALDALGTKSYLAIPIINDNEEVIGHIAVQDQRERDWNSTDFDILGLFASRASAELKRRGHEGRLERINDQLQNANANLRKEVAMRLEMEQQLARAKSIAEESQSVAESANQAKSSFLAHMSHELRTPLNGILGYAQLLKRDESLGATQLESVQVIERSGEHLLTLINDLLDLAKIESGRLELHLAHFDLPQLLRHVADLGSVRAVQAGINFDFECAADVPMHLWGDERALRQILINLLGNAVKFTEHGGVKFRVRVAGTTAEKSRLRFEIEDSGAGIAPCDLEKVFEPFVRGSADRHIEGTGLGLPITRRLVDALQGKLAVHSQPGRGSTFSVELDFERDVRTDTVAALPVNGFAAPARPLQNVQMDGQLATHLYDLAMKGDVKGVLAQVESAERLDPNCEPLYKEVRRLAHRYDMKGIRSVLRSLTGSRK